MIFRQSDLFTYKPLNHLTRIYGQDGDLMTLRQTIIEYMMRGENIYLSDFGGLSERLIRDVISKQRPIGPIYLPDGDGQGRYVNIDCLDQEVIEAYNATQIASARSHYFNTIRPILAYSEIENNKALMGTLDLAYGSDDDN